MRVGRRGPGSLLDGVCNVMHIFFDIPVRFEMNFKSKTFIDMTSESRPIRRFCAEGGWAGLGDRSGMHGYNVITGEWSEDIESSLRLDAMRRDPLRDTEVKEVGDFPSVTGPIGRH
jgi:hypothetical protein